jgi:hypothetical protein
VLEVKEKTPQCKTPALRTTQVKLWLQVENNNKFVRGENKSRTEIEEICLSRYQAKKLSPDGFEYELTFHHTYEADLQEQINELAKEMEDIADSRNGCMEADFIDLKTGMNL